MNPVIEQLINEVIGEYNSSKNIIRKQLWIDHNHLVGKRKILFNLQLWKLIDHKVWYEIIPNSELKTKGKYDKFVEVQLRRKLFKFKYIDDDDVILPTIWVSPVMEKHEPLFGVEPEIKIPKRSGGKNIRDAKRYVSLINDIEDLRILKKPNIIVNKKKTEEKVSKIKEIVNYLVPVKIIPSHFGASPFESVVHFRDTEKIYYDFVDKPEFVHKIMTFFTNCIVEHYKRLDRNNEMDPESTWDFRVHFDKIENKKKINSIKNCWVYISAQSAAGISPKMYEEFLQPYHTKIAELFGKGKVYYHGCEDLTEKFSIIKNLPNLRRFHISPWSNLEKILNMQQKQFVYEVAVNTTNHLFVFNNKQIADDLIKMKKIIIENDVTADVNMIDIETIEYNPKKLIEWSKIAKDVLHV